METFDVVNRIAHVVRDMSFISGGPSSKLAIRNANAILSAVVAETAEAKIVCCSVTGRGARSLGLSTSRESVTLQSLLDSDSETIGADILILSDIAMMSEQGCKKLCKKLSRETTVLLIGDPYQLPPLEDCNRFGLE